jgi:hypothetical protein
MDGLLYLLDVTGRSLQAVTEQRDALQEQVLQLREALVRVQDSEDMTGAVPPPA